MNKKTILQSAVALAAAGFLTAAVAGDDAFSKLDVNADGAISSEEATASEALYKGWEAADANQDGKVDSAEFSAFEASGSAPSGN
jgi:Ca2+-binding EF-hand superfamily protein